MPIGAARFGAWGGSYTGSPPPPPPPPPEGSGSLLGNPNFNPASPTWKNGQPITGEYLTAFNGLHWWRTNPAQHNDVSPNTVFAQNNLYELARVARPKLQVCLIALRLTGDLRFLDTCVTWLNMTKNTKAVRSNQSGWTAPPYEIWTWDGAPIANTDLSTMNESKWHAGVAEVLYALYLNRNFSSPAGHNYHTEYVYWHNYFANHFFPKWSGSPTTGWASLYRGVRKLPTTGLTPGNAANAGRPSFMNFPMVVNGGDYHSTTSSAMLNYACGRVFPDSVNGVEEAEWIWSKAVDGTDTRLSGQNRVWAHATFSHVNVVTPTAQSATYMHYHLIDWVSAYLEPGAASGINDTFLTQITNAVENLFWVKGVTSTSGSAVISHQNIIGPSNLAGLVTGGGGSPATQSQLPHRAFLVTMRWNPSGYLKSEAMRILNTTSIGGSLSQPRGGMLPLGILLEGAPL